MESTLYCIFQSFLIRETLPHIVFRPLHRRRRQAVLSSHISNLVRGKRARFRGLRRTAYGPRVLCWEQASYSPRTISKFYLLHICALPDDIECILGNSWDAACASESHPLRRRRVAPCLCLENRRVKTTAEKRDGVKCSDDKSKRRRPTWN
jgi:hypothetical protein